MDEKLVLNAMLAMPLDELKVHYLHKICAQSKKRIAHDMNISVYKVNKIIGNIVDYIMNDPVLKNTSFNHLDSVTLKNVSCIEEIIKGKYIKMYARECESCGEEINSSNSQGAAEEMNMCNACYQEHC